VKVEWCGEVVGGGRGKEATTRLPNAVRIPLSAPNPAQLPRNCYPQKSLNTRDQKAKVVLVQNLQIGRKYASTCWETPHTEARIAIGLGYMQEFHKPENIQSAITEFGLALQIDPQYGLAYAGTGEAYWLGWPGRPISGSLQSFHQIEI